MKNNDILGFLLLVMVAVQLLVWIDRSSEEILRDLRAIQIRRKLLDILASLVQ
jgi:hypothetical protein